MMMTASPGSGEGEYVSSVICQQLRLQVCRSVLRMEADVLSKVDKLIQSKDGIGRRNPLATWACLLLLTLCYKEYMAYAKATRQGQSTNQIYGLNQHLYNMLTSIYAALYKTTSPLTLDWRKKEVAAMMRNDAHLINLFCNIKTEMFWFR